MKKLFYTKKGNLIICTSVLTAVLAAVFIIDILNIKVVGILPPCFINSLFGIRCAGCGGTRAVNAFIHGRIDIALYYNPLFTFLGFFFIYLFIKFFINALKKNYTPPSYDLKPWVIVALTASIIGFMLVRNFDFYKAFFY